MAIMPLKQDKCLSQVELLGMITSRILDSMPDILNQLLKRIEHKDENIINELRNGYNYACSDFSWKHWTRKWISLLTAYGYN